MNGRLPEPLSMFGHSHSLLRQIWRSNERITTEITLLSTRAAGAPAGRRATLYEAAARLCRGSGRDGQAWLFYGCAIDDHLLGGAYVQADALCEEFIATYPEIVRARCTYAFLALRHERPAEFMRRAALYETAAVSGRQSGLAIARLALMRRVASDARIHIYLDERLRTLRTGEEAAAARIGVLAGPSPISFSATSEQRWLRALKDTIIGPTCDIGEYVPVMGGN